MIRPLLYSIHARRCPIRAEVHEVGLGGGNDGMMARRGVFGLLAGAAAAVLGGCGMMGHTYRYKLTVEVETPDGLRTGYAVREVSWSPGVNITAEADTASMTHCGEAAMVDLPNGQVLFALLSPDGQETPMLAFGSARQTAWSDDEVKGLQPPAQPETAYGQSGYPRLVRFRDIGDSKTVEKVDPANLAASFGPGYRLKRITAQIVSDDVTEKVKTRLRWLSGNPEPRLNPKHGPDDWSLPAILDHGDFVWNLK